MRPLGPWLPDTPTYERPGLIEARNVFPREDGSYSPVPSLEVTSAALEGRCYGLISAKSTDGIAFTFAGTLDKLFRLQTNGTWLDVSKSGGYPLTSNAGDRWRGAVYGDRLLMVGGTNTPPQSFNLASGSQFGDLAVGAPKAAHIGVVEPGFVMLGQTNDPGGGVRSDQVWWSGIGDESNWPTIGTIEAISVQSSRQVLPDGGFIQGIAPGVGGAAAAVFGESRIWRCTYEGPPTIFRFDAVERERGIYIPGSLVTVGKIAYYFSKDGWYAFDGVQSIPIGTAKVDRWFVDDFDDGFRDSMWATIDTDRKCIVWLYPGADNILGYPNKLLIFNWTTGNWSHASMELETLAQLTSVGYTLEALDALGFTLDTLPFSLDSRIWAGGGGYLGGVNEDHKLGQLGETNLEAALSTSEFSGPNGSRFWLSNVRAYSDCATVAGQIRHRDTIAGALNETGYITQDEDVMPHLVAARYGRLDLRFPAGATWSNAYGYDLDMRQEGKR